MPWEHLTVAQKIAEVRPLACGQQPRLCNQRRRRQRRAAVVTNGTRRSTIIIFQMVLAWGKIFREATKPQRKPSGWPWPARLTTTEHEIEHTTPTRHQRFRGIHPFGRDLGFSRDAHVHEPDAPCTLSARLHEEGEVLEGEWQPIGIRHYNHHSSHSQNTIFV